MTKRTLWITALTLAVGLMLVFSVTAADNVGAEKCKMCHKAQYKSWAASKHAAADPKTECETCHGPGSDYKSMKVMKDPTAAKAAGLILPTKATCTEKCHKTITDEQFAGVHEHKAK
jgi:cytochrome c553